jgi:mRNA-degrading endonuclease toxin of MazEF toxin-antitoxin module
VVSHDAFNESVGWRSVIVVPLSTSGAQKRRGPTAVILSKGVAGIDRESVALCHQVTTLDRAKLKKRIAVLPAAELAAVGRGLMIAQDLG